MKAVYLLAACFVVAHAANLERFKRQTKALAFQLPAGAELYVSAVDLSFSCQDKPYGYYADTANDCKLFHVCVPPAKLYSFMCGNLTVFDQSIMTCTHPESAVSCGDSEKYYILNQNFGITDPAQLVVV
ncbi:uncharacterized protein LOC143224956 [Tachypleus tridentatus]|uniref:uncharacterized protein LOC143224956 n=1 Tax=Tachypleus tridentatus TaxID=6853 RepID=UPI003FD092D1